MNNPDALMQIGGIGMQVRAPISRQTNLRNEVKEVFKRSISIWRRTNLYANLEKVTSKNETNPTLF